jgi:hypothetical protein
MTLCRKRITCTAFNADSGAKHISPLCQSYNGNKNRLGLKMRIGLFAVAAGVVVLSFASPAIAQRPSPQAASIPAAKTGMDVLKGAWVRPDGGYTITIRNIAANGQLEATYANPNLLPFSKAQATQDGATLRASFELQAGGYAGSTYELAYDPVSDRLKGIYYQAVAKQKFEIYFVRK